MLDNYLFLDSIKKLTLEEQNIRLKEQLEYLTKQHQEEIVFLHNQISKYSSLYNECQDQLYKSG